MISNRPIAVAPKNRDLSSTSKKSAATPSQKLKFILFGDNSGWKSLRTYIMFATLLLPSVIALPSFVLSTANDPIPSFLISLSVGEIVMSLCYWGTHVIMALDRCFFLFVRKQRIASRSTMIHMAISGILLLPAMVAGFAATGYLSQFLGFQWQAPDLRDYKYGFLVAGLNMAVFLVASLKWEATKLAKELLVKQQEHDQLLLKTRISTLTAQMSPHLLFNTLNTIASMISDSPEIAEDLTVELSKFYRHILDATKRDIYPLESELGFCRSYLSIEKSRFLERLSFHIDVHSDLTPSRIKFPVLLLQPLVENALKHGILQKVAGGSVKLVIGKEQDHLCIEISDDGIGFNVLGASVPVGKGGSGTAIQNCKDRLKLLYGDQASLTIADRIPWGTRASLKIPLELYL